MYRKRKELTSFQTNTIRNRNGGPALIVAMMHSACTMNMTKAIHLAVTMKTVRTIGPKKIAKNKEDVPDWFAWPLP